MTHKWDYEHPTSDWETLPFWLRWPLAVVGIIIFLFFATAPFHPWMNWPH